MLRTKLNLIGAGLLALALSTYAHAGDIRLDSPATVKDVSDGLLNYSVLQAYPDAKNCRIWYYMAARQVVTGSFYQWTDVTSLKIDGAYKLAFLTNLDLRGNPMITTAHRDQLAGEIVKAMKGDPICKNENLKVEDIVLFPARAHVVSDTKLSRGGRFYSDVAPTNGTTDSSYTDASDPMGITLMTDASNPRAAEELRNKIEETKKGAMEIGRLHYVLEGVTSELNATLSVKGKLNAKFDSAVKQTSCTTDNRDIAASGAGFAAGLGAAPGAGGGAAGAGSFGLSDHRTVCNYQLLTQFEGGEFGIRPEFDFSGFNFYGADKRPIQIVSCDEKGKCIAMNLESYVRQQLWALWISNYMDTHIKQITDKTFEITLGRKGDVNVTLDAVARYRRSFYGELAIEVPVVAQNLQSERLDFSPLQAPVALCAQDSYLERLSDFEAYVGIYPLPLDKNCLVRRAGVK